MRGLFIIFVLNATLAFAQTDENTDIYLSKPPVLIKNLPVEVPAKTVFPAEKLFVQLEISIDEKGNVVSVRFINGPGEPFNDAALKTAQQLSFTPAYLNTGEPVPVTITFQLTIEKPVPPPVESVFKGTLLERGTRKPLVGIDISIQELKTQEIIRQVVTNQNGLFEFSLPVTKFKLVITASTHQSIEEIIELQDKETRTETIYLEKIPTEFETIIRSQRVKREVVQQSISKELVDTVAGTQGDTLKVVQNLPGVARPSFGGGTPVLRGSSPGDSKIFLEGQEIPVLYHFGGLRSTFNSVFLESVDFVPGNYQSKYGRAMGGIIDVKVRQLADDLFRGQADINFYDATLSLEGPVSETLSIGGAFRRSYIDSVLPLVLPDDAPLSFNAAPRYYDYQFIADWKPNGRHKFRMFYYGGLDKVSLLFDEPTSDPLVRDEIAARIMFHNLQFQYKSILTQRLTQKSTFLVGLQEIDTDIGPELYFKLQSFRIGLRTDWEYRVTDWIIMYAGMDINYDIVGLDLNSPLRGVEGEQQIPTGTQQLYRVDEHTNIYNPAAYVEFSLQPIKKLSLTPSIRIDYYDELKKWAFDPRLTMRYEISPQSAIAAGIGMYQQPPSADQSFSGLGNPSLIPQRSIHYSVSAYQQFSNDLNLQITGFYKSLDKLVYRNAFETSDGGLNFLNGNTGKVYGAEVLVKMVIGERFQGWLAYTYQRSMRTDTTTGEERPFDYDQPHILTFVGTYSLPWNLRFGARFRLVSGNPYSPVIANIYDAGSGLYIPRYGNNNSARLPTFHQLDIRIDKNWIYNTWQLSLYLDVQNIYNRKNPEGIQYNYDYTQYQYSSGLPILPIIGVKGEW